MMMTKKQPRTLYRADPRESVLDNDIVIRISVTSAIILALALFLIICFLLVPATHGFYWW
jgi:fucose permease